MLVLATLAILIAVLIPHFSAYKNVVKNELCHIKCEQLEKTYEVFLIKINSTQAQELFDGFLKEYGEDVCPDGGRIYYLNGNVKCEKHSVFTDSDDSDGGDEDVPFL